MNKHALLLSGIAALGSTIAVATLLLLSIRAGVAPVTIPIAVLVLGPALAAAAMVATCSIVAPPLAPQPLMRAVELRATSIDNRIEGVG